MTKLERLGVCTMSLQLAFFTAATIVCNGVASLNVLQMAAVAVGASASLVLAAAGVLNFTLSTLRLSVQAPASA